MISERVTWRKKKKDPERTEKEEGCEIREKEHTPWDVQRGNCVCILYMCVCEEKEGRRRDEASQPGCVPQRGGGCCSSSGSLAVSQH